MYDHEESPLRISDLAALNLRNARLAFLAACETGRSSPQLADESVHLAAACQLAGFSHVIGTLWPISDIGSLQITQLFYPALALDPDRSAIALHEAIRVLRAKYRELPSLWAAFVHVGP